MSKVQRETKGKGVGRGMPPPGFSRGAPPGLSSKTQNGLSSKTQKKREQDSSIREEKKEEEKKEEKKEAKQETKKETKKETKRVEYEDSKPFLEEKEKRQEAATCIKSEDYEPLPPQSRPQKGRKGKPIELRANFFKLIHQGKAFQYDVQIEPEQKSTKMRRRILYYAENLEGLRGVYPVYDGNALLYSARPLAASTFPLIFEISKSSLFPKSVGPRGDEKRTDKAKKEERITVYTVKIAPTGKDIGELDMKMISKYITREEKDIPRSQLQALDVAMRYKGVKTQLPMGRCTYSPNREGYTCSLGGGASLLWGHFQTVRACQAGLMLNVDLAATAVTEPLLIPEYLRAKLGRLPEFPRDSNRVRNLLKGLLVHAVHREREKDKKHKIENIGKTPATEDAFEYKGTRITVADYFKERYRPLRFPQWPCLKVGSKQMTLPMEVCQIAIGQRPKYGLTSQQRQAMIQETCLPPQQRQDWIYESVPDDTNDPYMKAFGLKLEKQMVKVTGRVIPPPELKYLDEKSGQPVPTLPRNGTWQLRGLRFVNAKKIQNCPIVIFGSESNMPTQYAETWIKRLQRTCAEKGMQWSGPIRIRRAENSERGVNDAFAELAKSKPQIVFCFLNSAKEDIYRVIKRETETKYGFPTQCVDYTKATHQKVGGVVYQANIALKMNVKLGGTHTIVNHKLPLVSEKPTLILAADVHHPSAGNKSASSIAAIVGSTNKHFTTYAVVIQEQGHRVEHISGMEAAARKHLLTFEKREKKLPEQIIMYRDGVGEGHFGEIVSRELQAIQRACFSIKASYKPKITFSIVQKRNRTRLFLEDPSQGDREGRLPPGTVVDSGIVSNEYDVYLNSHAGLKGTSKPTHYHILWDDIGFSTDDFVELTYALCHIYQRCTRSISIPAPAYYAHLAAYRARLYRDDDTMSESSSQPESQAPAKALPVLVDSMYECHYYC